MLAGRANRQHFGSGRVQTRADDNQSCQSAHCVDFGLHWRVSLHAESYVCRAVLRFARMDRLSLESGVPGFPIGLCVVYESISNQAGGTDFVGTLR